MRTRNVLTIVLTIAMVFAMTPMARADLNFDFEDGTFQGWTATSGTMWLTSGDTNNVGPPWAIESSNMAGTARSHDGQHVTLIASSPAFYLDPTDVSDLTFVLMGGQADEAFPGGYDLTTLLADHPMTENNSGYAGVALRNVATGDYFFEQHRTGSGGNKQAFSISAAQLDTLDQGAEYQLDFIDWNQGGWGWTQVDDIHIPGSQNDGTLNSIISGDYDLATTWAGTVAGGVPTSLSIANILNGHTVTTTAAGANALELNIETGGTLTVGDATSFGAVNINGGVLNVPAGETLTAASSNTNGLALGDATATLAVGNLRVDSALALADYTPVVGNDVTVVAGGTFTTVGETVGAAETIANLILDGGTLIDATGLSTTDGSWGNLHGGVIHSSTILNGDKDIIINNPGGSTALVVDGTNSATTPKIRVEAGALRGLPSTTDHLIELASNSDTEPAAFELTADGTITLGTGVQQINIVDRGSFASAGGVGVNVNVTLAGTGLAPLVDPLTQGMIRGGFRFGSRSGTGKTTVVNPINLENADRNFYVYASNADPAYSVELGGALSNVGRIYKRGDGTLSIPALTTAKRLEVFDGTFKPTGDHIHSTGNRDESIFVNGPTARLEVPAGVFVDAHFLGLTNNATVDVAGTLRSRNDWIDTYSGTDIIVRSTGFLQGGDNNFDHNLALANAGTTLTVEDGGRVGANYMQWWADSEILINGNVWTQQNRDRLRMYQRSKLTIGATGSLRSGSNEAGDVTANRNWDIDDNGTTILIEHGGFGEGHRLHLRNWSNTTVQGTLQSNENIYVQSQAKVIVEGTVGNPALLRSFNYMQTDHGDWNTTLRVTVGPYGTIEAGHDNGNYNRDGFRLYDGTLDIQLGGEVYARWMEVRRRNAHLQVDGTLTLREDLRHEESESATISGTGQINARSVYIRNGSNDISPGPIGGGTGILNVDVSGEFKMEGSSIYAFELGSQSNHDLIAIDGKLNLDDGWKVVVTEAAGATGGILPSHEMDLFTFTSIQDGLRPYTLDVSALQGDLLWDVSGATLGVDGDSVFLTGIAFDQPNPVDTYYWLDDVDPDDWSEPEEWERESDFEFGPPTGFDKAIVESGTAQVTSVQEVHTLAIDGGAVEVLSDSLTVSNDVDLTAGSLTVAAGTALNGVNYLNMSGGTSLDVDGTVTAQIVNLDGTVNLNPTAVLNTTTTSINGGTTTVGDGATVNGDFTVDGGTLAIGGNVGLANLVFNAGGFAFGGNTLTVGTYRQTGGVSTVASGALVASEYILEGGTVGFAMADASPSPVTSSGNVTLAAGAAHTYTGGTMVEGGTLIVNDDITQTATLDVMGGATINLNASVTTTHTGPRDVLVSGGLIHKGFHENNDGQVCDLNNNGGMMVVPERPSHYGTTILTNGPGNRGIDFTNDGDFIASGVINQTDNYSNLFLGQFKAPETGTYVWRFWDRDDPCGIWIDLDQDGVFESSTPGLGADRGEQLEWNGHRQERSVSLTEGETYMIAFTHREGGGGSQIEPQFKTPSIDWRTVRPADGAQAGLWLYPTSTTSSTLVGSGGTLNINATGSLTTDLLGVDGTVNVEGALTTGGASIGDGGRMNAKSAIALANTVATVGSGGIVDFQVAQSASPQILFESFSILKGDLTNLAYSNTPGAGVITFEDNVIVDPSTGAATHPLLAEVGGTAKLLYSLKSAAASVMVGELIESLGDTAFKGVFIGPDYPNGGTYTGTLTSGAGDIYILQDRDVRHNGTESLVTASGNVQIDVLGGGTWVQAGSFFGGTGTADRVDIDYDPALKWNNTERVYFEGDGAIPDGKTVAFSGVRARTNNNNNFRGTVEIGDGGSLYVHNNIANHAGTRIVVTDGGNLWISDDDRLQTIDPAKVTFSGESTLVLQANNQAWNTGENDALIMLKADIQIVDNWAYKGTQGLMIGDGHYLKGGYNAGESRVHGNSTFFRAEPGATWVGMAAFSRRWMNIDEPFDAQGADVYLGSDTEMWTNLNHDNHTRRTEVPTGIIHFRQPVTPGGTMYLKSGQLWIDNDRTNGTDFVVQGANPDHNDWDGGMRLNGTGWRLHDSTITIEDDGHVWIENWNNDTKVGSMFINTANGMIFQGGEQLRIVTRLGGTGGVKNGNDGHIRLLNTATVAPGDTSATAAGVGTLSVDDLFSDAGFSYDFQVGPISYDQVAIGDRLELANAWTLNLFSDGGVMVPATEYDLFTYGGSYAGSAGDITGQVTIDAGTTGWDIGAATVHQTGGRIYITGVDGLEYRYWKAGSGTWGDVSTPPSVNWEDGTPVDATPPGAGTLAIIDNAGQTATVATAGQLAYQVDLDNGSLVISTGELTVGNSVNVVAGTTLDLQATGTLNAYTVNTAGTTTLAGGGTITNLNITGGTTTTGTPAFTNITVGVGGILTANAAIAATGDATLSGILNTGSNFTAAGTLTLDAGTVNVSGVSDMSTGTGSTAVKNAPDLNITNGGVGHLTIFAGGGGSLPEGLQAHYSASEGVTVAGGKVTNWEDLSGNGHHGARPTNATVLSGELNGFDVIDFGDNAHGNGSYLDVAGNFDAEVVYTVFRNRTDRWRNYGAVFGRRSGRNANWLFENNNTNFHGNQHPESVNRNGVEIGNPYHINPINEFMVLRVDYNENAPNTDTYFINRSDHSASDLLIAEILVFDHTLTAEEENNIGGYLASKYDIATTFTGGFGTAFGSLNMGDNTQLTLDGPDGLGTGDASFASIAAGDGSIINGNVTAAGAIAAGSSPGTLTINGNYVAEASSNQIWEEGDLIDVDAGPLANGDLTLEDGWTVSVVEAGAMVPGTQYDLLQYEGDMFFGDSPAGVGGFVTNATLDFTGADPSWIGISMMYSSDTVFLVSPVDASWIGAVDDDWTALNWDWDDGGGAKGPPGMGAMTIADGTVTISTPVTGLSTMLTVGGGAAGTLNVNSTISVVGATDITGTGAVTVGVAGALTAASVEVGATASLTVNGELNTSVLNTAGTTAFNGGSTGSIAALNVTGGITTLATPAISALDVSGGTLNTAALAVDTFTAGGAATVAATGAITITGDAEIASTFTTNSDVTAGGELSFDGADDNIITVNGTAVFTGANDATSIVSNPNITLTSTGDLTIKGPSGMDLALNQLNWARYNGANTPGGLTGINDGVINQDQGGLFDVAPTTQSLWTQNLQGPEGGGGDNFSEMYWGYFVPPTTGNYKFKQWADDHEAVWLDLNRNGDFETGEDILMNVPPEGWNVTKETTVALQGGEAYMFAAAFYEIGGGQNSHFQIDYGSGFQYINPGAGAQAGMWGTGSVIPGGIFGTLTMDAGSTLTLESTETATFEQITAADGTTINGNIAIEGAISTGASPGVLTVNGDYVATADSEQTWEIGDLIDVSGDVTLADGWALTIAEAGVMAAGVQHDLIAFGGGLTLGETPVIGSGLLTNGDALTLTGGDASWLNATLMYDADSIFVVGSVNALWDGVVNGDWADANWDWQDAGALKIPSAVGYMTIDQGGTVAISAPVAGMVLSLDVGGAGGGTLNVGSTIDVTSTTNLTGAGVVNVGAGGVFGSATIGVAGTAALTVQNGGTVNSAGLVDIVEGSLTVDLGGTLNGATSVDVATGASLTVAGALNSPAVNTAGTSSFASSTTGVGQVNITDGSTTMTGDLTGGIGHVLGTGGTLVSGAGLQLSTLELDGGTANASTAMVITDTLTLGSSTVSNGTSASFALSGGDVATARTIGLTQAGVVNISGNALLPGTLGAWTFDDDTADDSSGNGFDGNMGAGSFAGDVPATLAGGRSVNLNGNGWIAVETATNTEFNLDVMTVSFWAKEFPTDSWGAYVSKRGDGGNGWKIRRRGGDPWLIFTVRGKGNDDWGVPVDVGAFNSDWQHVIMTVGDGFRRIYVNDVLLGELAEGGNINDTGSALMFGSWDNTNNAGTPAVPENGGGSDSFMDDIYILDRVVTADERTKLFTNNFSLSMPGTSLQVSTAGAIVNINAGRVDLGNLTFDSGMDSLEIQGATMTSFNDLTIVEELETTITVPTGGGIGVRGALADESGDLITNFNVTGSLTMEGAGSALYAYGDGPDPADLTIVSVTDFINDGGLVEFDEFSVLNLVSSTLANLSGDTVFSPDAAITVNGGAGDIDLTVEGGILVLPTALPGQIGVLTLTGGQLDGDSGPALIVNDKLVTANGEIAIDPGNTFQVVGPNVGAERSLVLDTAASTLTIGGATINTPNTHLQVGAAGITLDVTGGGPPQLGNLVFGAGQTEITIGTAGDVSFADVVLDTNATINTPGGAGTVGVSGTAKNAGGGDLTGNLAIDGNLRVNATGTLNAVGTADVSAKSFVGEGTADFAAGTSLTLDGNLIVNDNETTFAPGSAVGGTVNQINVSAGQLTTPAGVSTTTLEIGRTGATMIAPEPVTVTQTATLGGLTLEHAGPVGTSFSVQGLDLANDGVSRTVMLNGGTITTGGGAPAGLVHRYEFSENSGLVIADSVGTANAQIVNLGGTGEVNGQGGHTMAQDNGNGAETRLWGGGKGNSDWIQIPAAAFTEVQATENATFEFWATMHQLQNWSRLFSFGSNNADVIHSAWTHGTNRGTDRQEWRDTGGGNHVNRDNTMQPYNDGVEYHIVWTIANAGGDSTVRFFKDGQFRGTFGPTPNKLSMLNMTEAALGRSKWGDATANASYNEFRIYDKVLTDQEIADSGTAGADGLSGAADLTATTIGAAAGSDSTLTLNLEAGLPAVMSGIDVGNAATLTLDSPAVAVELTNMALRGGSTFQSSYAVADAPVTVTVSEKLSTSGGGDFIGDAGAPGTGVGADLFFTNLTLVDGAVPADVDVEWTLTSPTRTDVDGGGMMVAIGDSVNVYGTLDMADGLTIQLVDGLAAGVNASGVDVALFKVSDEAIIDGVLGSAWTPADVAKITVLSPIGAPVAWTWDSLAYLNDEFVVLTNLVTGVHPGDANGDNKVNEEDLVILNDEWGQRGGSLNSDFDGDGDVDLDDFQILNAEFGYDGTGGGAPELPGSETPEPATMTLLALGGLLVIRRRRRKA